MILAWRRGTRGVMPGWRVRRRGHFTVGPTNAIGAGPEKDGTVGALADALALENCDHSHSYNHIDNSRVTYYYEPPLGGERRRCLIAG
jgi:hypothetical protein